MKNTEILLDETLQPEKPKTSSTFVAVAIMLIVGLLVILFNKLKTEKR